MYDTYHYIKSLSICIYLLYRYLLIVMHGPYLTSVIFFLESNIFYVAKSECKSVLIAILMVEMDSTPSETFGAPPKIPELDNRNLDFEKLQPIFFKLLRKKSITSDPNRQVLDHAIQNK